MLSGEIALKNNHYYYHVSCEVSCSFNRQLQRLYLSHTDDENARFLGAIPPKSS